MLTTEKTWLAPLPWEAVTETNQQMCQGKENAPHRPGKGFDQARSLWTDAAGRPLKLRQALDICRACHALAPFGFFNGNTMAAVSRKIIDEILQLLPSLEAQMLRNAVGNYVAGVIRAKELETVCAHTTAVLSRRPPPSQPTLAGPASLQPAGSV